MDHWETAQPRDSRLDRFSNAAINIISNECGLTATALAKIHLLASRQRLTDQQVTECLNKISAGGSDLGRVGRYEQLLLERLAKELPQVPGAVLSPAIERAAIQIATDEFKISPPRACQLLMQMTQQIGLLRVSTADAKKKLRRKITERLRTEDFERSDLVNEVAGLANCFGISRNEVDQLIDSAISTCQQQRWQQKRWLLFGVGVVCCLGIAIILFGSAIPVEPFSNETPPNRSSLNRSSALELPQAIPKDAGSEIARQGADFNVQRNKMAGPAAPNQRTVIPLGIDTLTLDKDTELTRTEPPRPEPPIAEPSFDNGYFTEIESWHQRLVDLANVNLSNQIRHAELADTKQVSSADRRKIANAILKLQTEVTDGRTQIRGLEDLGALTKNLIDISVSEANVIAVFCLQAKEESVKIAIQRVAQKLARWPSFLLALSDHLSDDRAELSTAPTIRQELSASSSHWHQRLVSFVTDQNLHGNADLSHESFSMAMLRVQERVLTERRGAILESQKAEAELAGHIQTFVSTEIKSRSRRSYFNRLIATRNRNLQSMVRRIELHQVLIEAMLFAKEDAASIVLADKYLREISTATTLGQQLTASSRAMVQLSQRHLSWRKQPRSSGGAKRSLTTIDLKEARRLRDRAELAVVLNGNAKIANAKDDYMAAMTCGDSALIRSCLRGLIGITECQSEKNRYQRHFDFISGGNTGPYSFSIIEAEESLALRSPRTQTQRLALSTLCAFCRQIRRTEARDDQADDVSKNTVLFDQDIGKILKVIASKPRPLSPANLGLVLRIESAAELAIENNEAPDFEMEFPWELQRSLSPVKMTPLVPLTSLRR